MGDDFVKGLLENDLVQLICVVLFLAVIAGGLRGYLGWEEEWDDLEQCSSLPNNDGWSLHDCSSSHLDHKRFD